MKILLLNDYGSAAGGAEMITHSLRKELHRRGHDVRMFVSNAHASLHSIDPDYECFGTVGSLRTVNQCINLRAAFSLRRVLGQFQPDVVHINLYLTQLSPWILPVIRGIPSVYYALWNRAICPLGTRRTPNGNHCTNRPGTSCLQSRCLPFHDWLPIMGQIALDRRWRGAFTRVVAISRSVKDQFDEFGRGPLLHAQVIYPGTPVVSPRDTMSEHPLIVFAGRLVTEKGAEILLQAFAIVLAKNPACRLVVAGDGPQRPALEQLSEKLALRHGVTFPGHLTHDEILETVRKAWVVCVPSLWEEPFGLIAAEAQMNGVAVIASNTGGLREIVRDQETGFLVEPGQPDALAKSIGPVLANRNQAIALGLAGHAHARDRFSIDAFGDQFELLYRSILKGRSEGRRTPPSAPARAVGVRHARHGTDRYRRGVHPMTMLPAQKAVDREPRAAVVYSSESRLRDPIAFARLWVADLRASGPTAHRFFKRSLTQRYRLSSLGVAWAFAPSVLTAIVLIAGQRASVIGTGSGEVPPAFYGVFGLAVAQTFLESLNGLRVLFTGHQHMLRRNNVAIEGLILAAFIEVLFGVLVRLIVLSVVFFLFGVRPRFETLALAFTGLLGVVLVGAGLGLLLAPASSLRSDIDQVIHLLPWGLFAVTPVFVAPAAGSLLERGYATNPLAWVFDSIRTAAYGASGSLVPALAAPLVGALLVSIGWFFCRFCRPYVVERYLV